MIDVTIIIPTYNRPDYLARALAACTAQRGADATFEILIVDNNPDGSARSQVAAAAQDSNVLIRYVHEARAGISHARNTGVAAATGRYLVFIDDDQEPDPGCLAALVGAIRRFTVDAVFGAIYPMFPVASVHPYAREKFSRDIGRPTGCPIPAGSPMRGMFGICNTILDKERCFTDGVTEPFKPWLGFQGGEDTLFFRQLLQRGRKMVWCAEAIVRETIPAERLGPEYLLRRAFNNGQISASTWGALDPPARTRMLTMMAVGCAQMALFGPPALVLRLLHKPGWLTCSARVAGGLGKLLCHPKMHLRIYR
jgi:glycosyltransferase involved in cell wall biosynthesis